MPLKMSSNSKGTWITWESEDDRRSATFKIKATDTDQEILATLIKATRFISAQMEQPAQLDLEIMSTTPGVSAPATATGAVKHLAPAIAAPVAADPNAPRVPMMPPASLSDRPSDGGPTSTFGWSSMPTTTVPAELAAPQAGGWEMIPPGEM